MKRGNVIALAVLAAALAACSEPAQVAQAPQAPGYQSDGWRDQLRERTLRQDESRRVYQ